MSKRMNDSIFMVDDGDDEDARSSLAPQDIRERTRIGDRSVEPPGRKRPRLDAPSPGLSRGPNSARGSNAPRTPVSQAIDLTAIKIDSRDKNVTEVPEAEFPDYVKRRGTVIFGEAATDCLNDNSERHFEDWPHVLAKLNKDKIVDRYEHIWRKELVKAKESIAKQLKEAEERKSKEKWEHKQKAYGRDYVKPLNDQLETAIAGIEEFDYLIALIKDPDGQLAASKKKKRAKQGRQED